MTATSGRKCAALLTRSDRVSSWQKTLLATSRWVSTLFWLTWKPTATPQGRLLFRLVPSTPSTGATGSGYSHTMSAWPTPRHEGFDAGAHRGKPDSLHAAVKLWPTPVTTDHKQNYSPSAIDRNTPQLGTEVHLRGGTTTGRLHGRWTLALMGFAPDHCDDLPPDPLGTTPT